MFTHSYKNINKLELSIYTFKKLRVDPVLIKIQYIYIYILIVT